MDDRTGRDQDERERGGMPGDGAGRREDHGEGEGAGEAWRKDVRATADRPGGAMDEGPADRPSGRNDVGGD